MTRSQLIERLHYHPTQTQLSESQLKLDHTLTQASEEMSNFGNIAAMTLGSASFKFFRAGSLGVMGRSALPGLNLLSYGGALGTEVVVFRGSHSLFQRIQGHTPYEDVFDKQGLLRTFTDFLALKGAGRLAQGQNFFLGQTLQSSAVVASRYGNAALGLLPSPTGSLFEQFLEAQTLNLAMMGGQSLFGMLSGHRVHILERNLELQSRAFFSENNSQPRFLQTENPSLLSMAAPGDGRKGLFRRATEAAGRLTSTPTAVAPLLRILLNNISREIDTGDGQNARFKLFGLRLLLHNATFFTGEIHDEIARLEKRADERISKSFPLPLSDAEAAALLVQMQQQLRDPRHFVLGNTAGAYTILGLLEFYRQELGRVTEKASIDRLTGLHNRNHLDESIPSIEKNLTEEAKKGIQAQVDKKAAAVENDEGFNLDDFFERQKEAIIQNYYKSPEIHDWVLMIDIDRFKSVNDTYGHANGDIALRHVADIVQENIRSIRFGGGDIAFRYGGEEMFIYLRNTDRHGVNIVAQRIQKQLAAEEVLYLNDQGTVIASQALTVTIGASRILPDLDASGNISYDHSIQRAQQRADHALYDGKRSGRNKLVIAPDRIEQDTNASAE